MSAVEVDGIWKYYGDFPALRNISFRVAEGDCVALLGRNGACKTTLLRIVAGLSRPAKGRILVAGEDARAHEVRRKIGFLGHGIAVYDELSAFENLRLFANLYGLPDPRRAAMYWLERTELERVRHGLVREFSRGMRQRLAVARARHEEHARVELERAASERAELETARTREAARLAADADALADLAERQRREAEWRARQIRGAELAGRIRKSRKTELRVGPLELYSASEVAGQLEAGLLSTEEMAKVAAALEGSP